MSRLALQPTNCDEILHGFLEAATAEGCSNGRAQLGDLPCRAGPAFPGHGIAVEAEMLAIAIRQDRADIGFAKRVNLGQQTGEKKVQEAVMPDLQAGVP